jgi:hypothetical protein
MTEQATTDDSSIDSAASALSAGLASRIAELEAALRWYVETDDVMEGGKWEEDNAFWLAGKRNAERLLDN